MNTQETIAAIATGGANSGIGIIRISGGDAVKVADRIYRSPKKKCLKEAESHTVHYGFIVEEDEILDEVLAIVMKGPSTYTGEDTVEIDCHGGMLVMERILKAVIRNGARLAQPGEFSKRAFLNGKMDLSKAEAVMDLIQAKNEYALKSSVSQLRGVLYDKITGVRQEILHEIAFIEAALDDPEHMSLENYPEELDEKVQKLEGELVRLMDSFQNGRMIREGIKTVIVGKPNAGKSSLLNLLLGEERAIVTDVAGTTRDILEENMNLSGISLNIVDTAGIRSTDDQVEKIGVSKARSYAMDADLIIYVVDSSTPLDESDEEIIELIRDRKALVLLNKTDLDAVTTEEELGKRVSHKIIPISAKERTGMDNLETALKDMFFHGEISFNDQVYITNVRHQRAIEEALDSLKLVEQSVRDGMPEDFYSIDLMNACEALGAITGDTVGEDLVNEIFSKFCMGK
ncbi:tRNA uridine-5-carboxymethylaminomethyl(34) synthesis GTPase MnmE [Diplocloster hominis]|uniref:tRNA uridine-5-carboxymethylaminomethyl(34) synthesis GTPase MnmE n=1 Tax=Diplocloster hominis TaxID=3079010 RepID=UPI0031BA1C03